MSVDVGAHLLDWPEGPDPGPDARPSVLELMPEPLHGGRTWLALALLALTAFGLTLVLVTGVHSLITL